MNESDPKLTPDDLYSALQPQEFEPFYYLPSGADRLPGSYWRSSGFVECPHHFVYDEEKRDGSCICGVPRDHGRHPPKKT